MTFRSTLAFGLFTVLTFSTIRPADAQVLEIGAGGSVIMHNRPEITHSDGAAPIFAGPMANARSESGALRSTQATLEHAAGAVALSPDLVEAVAWEESRLRHGVVSRKGAIGEMQLLPGTARELGVDPYDTAGNLHGGAAYLRALLERYRGDVVMTLAAYNAGPAAVDRYRGVPPFKETQAYVARVLEHMSAKSLGGGLNRRDASER